MSYGDSNSSSGACYIYVLCGSEIKLTHEFRCKIPTHINSYQSQPYLEQSRFGLDFGNQRAKWLLRVRCDLMYMHMSNYESSTNFNVTLRREGHVGMPDAFVKLHFYVLDSGEQRTHTQENNLIYLTNVCESTIHCTVPSDYLLMELNENFTLTICCDIEIRIPLTSSAQKDCVDVQPEDHLVTDFRNLLDTKIFSDVTLLVGNREFQAHKNILATRSPVFAAMFESKMKEAKENLVKIDDIEVDAFENVLGYMYTGKLPDLKKNVEVLFGVLYAADKYEIVHLKSISERELVSAITVESAAKILQIADMHNATLLKDCATQFIVANAKEVIKSEGWKVLLADHQQIANEVLLAIVDKRVS